MNKKLTYFIRSFMRISTIVVIWICLGGSLTYAERGHAQRLSDYKLNLAVGEESLHAVLTKISEQTRVSFAYDQEAVDKVIVKSGNYRNEPLDRALQSILAGTGYQYEVVNRNVVISKKPVPKPQKPGRIVGRVTDVQTGESLAGVTVQESITGKSTLTDESGRYVLELMPGSYRLSARYIGYEAFSKGGVTVAEDQSTNLNIPLTGMTSELDEVVVVGYGTQTKRELTTAVSQVTEENLNKVVGNTISAALKGKATGVRIYNSSGAPGTQSTITIRGGSSINKSNSPLILIDGMPGSLANVPTQDVESVEILKDAASTAIYGARASNGIVLVTTKSGKSGKTNFTGNVYYGYQNAGRRIDRLNAEEFLSVVRPAIERSNYRSWLTLAHPAGTGNEESSNFSTRYLQTGESVPVGWKSMPDPLDPTQTLIFEDTDVEDQVFQGGNVTNVYIAANGGTDRLKYMTSLGYTADEGFVKMSNWENFTLRSNFSYKLSDKLTLNSNLGFTRSYSDAINNEANIFSRSIHMAPTLRSVMPDGSVPGGRDQNFNNPMYILDNIVYNNGTLRFMGKMGLEWKLIDGLVAKVDGYYNPTYSHREYFQKANMYNSLRPAEYFGDFDQSTQFEATVNYAKDIGEDHKINALLGASSLSYNIYGYNARAQGGSSDDIITLNASSEYIGASSDRQREKLLSSFGRFSYSYKSRYLLSATMRIDASSKFASDNRIGYFPGVSAGYVLTEESFMDGVNWLDFMKIRASYGLTGNNAVGRYDYQGIWSIASVYNGMSASNPSSMPNRTLAWENSAQLDLGIDIGLFNNRISLNMDYYDKITRNLLFSKPLPNTSGFGSIESNIGRVKFYGYEVGLHARLLQREHLTLEIGGNLSYNMNRVLKLPENEFDKNRIGGARFTDGSGIGGIAEGERLYGIPGYLTAFIIDNQQQADNAMYDERAGGWDPVSRTTVQGRKFPGDFEWVDRSGDQRITQNDLFMLGYLVPTTTGGVHTTIGYRGFELYCLMDFALGHHIYDRQISMLNAYGEDGYVVPTKDVLEAWKEPGDAASTSFPRFDVLDGANSGQWNWYRTSNINVYDGSYWAIREVRLSYTFAENVARKLNLANLSVYASGLNLHYFSDYPGYVTEYSGANRNAGDNNYPNPRVISIGLNLGF